MSEMKMTKYHVLYLEDDPAHLAVDFPRLQQLLPIHISFAPSVKDAQEILSARRFDLFVLDIEIVGERNTGIQFAEEIRKQSLYATTPIIFTSMHTHYSQWLFSRIRHCSFLPKPFTNEALIQEMGLALGLPEYMEKQYAPLPLLLPYSKETTIEIDPLTISYIEASKRSVFIKHIDGQTVEFKCTAGTLKTLLDQIETKSLTFLRQIYRSIIINANQIKSIELEKNIGCVYLFNESESFPIGMNYRDNLRDFL